MRSRETIEREIYQAREDLEARLAELRRGVVNKVDVKARTRALVAMKKQQARELAQRGARTAKFAYHRAATTVRERPLLFGGIGGGVLLAGVVTLLLVRHYRRPWYERFF